MKKMSKQSSDGEAYRGYFIRPDLTQRFFYIQKDGFSIGSGRSMDDAKRIVDAVHGD